MEETCIVIMLKNRKTGFLEHELGSYTVQEHNEDYIYNTYAVETKNGYQVFMKLSCEKDVEDWEYSAIFDYYNTQTVAPYVLSIEEDDSQYNPAWLVSFPFSENPQAMEESIHQILKSHIEELKSVYAAIADKKDDYIDSDDKT